MSQARDEFDLATMKKTLVKNHHELIKLANTYSAKDEAGNPIDDMIKALIKLTEDVHFMIEQLGSDKELKNFDEKEYAVYSQTVRDVFKENQGLFKNKEKEIIETFPDEGNIKAQVQLTLHLIYRDLLLSMIEYNNGVEEIRALFFDRENQPGSPQHRR